MLLALELFTAVFGMWLLYVEVAKNRFRNFATSAFLSCFVPLFCVYPVAERLAVGGAYEVGQLSELIIGDPVVYTIYQFFCIGTLFVTMVTIPKKMAAPPLPNWEEKYSLTRMELASLLALSSAGVFLFIYSTGMPVRDLIAGSRFGWINQEGYSAGLFVISTYFLALSPVALMLSFRQPRHRWLATITLLAVLILYGLITKDRRWLIYIMSAALGYAYVKNRFSITLSKRAFVLATIAVGSMVFWQVGRSVLFDYYLTGKGDVVYESQQVAINLLTKGDFPYYYNASITAIDLNLNDDFIIPFGLIRRQVLFFLPANYSLGLKVEDLSALFSDAVGGEDSARRGNMPPGFFGLFAISFGWFGGIIVCSLFPLLLRVLDRVIWRNRGLPSIVLLAHMLSSILLLLRGDDSSATYFIISSMILICIARPSTLLPKHLARPHFAL